MVGFISKKLSSNFVNTEADPRSTVVETVIPSFSTIEGNLYSNTSLYSRV